MLFVVIGVAVIVLLSCVAAYYHYLLYLKRREQRQNSLALEQELSARREKNLLSVQVLSQAILDDQVTLTEASIRINALLQALALTEEQQESLIVFRQLAEATAHIPILDRWKALPRKRKREFDIEREAIEAKYRDFMVAAAKKIVHERYLVGAGA